MSEYHMSIKRELILVIIILTAAAIFFIAGLVHVILRFLTKAHNSSSSSSLSLSSLSSSPAIAPTTFRQRQLRQLFRLHDDILGLDRAVVEALPVFRFGELRNCQSNNNKPPEFDCPVCLCEFSARDELRLLPGCGHAFHVSCIDTWLLSNATCPLCRRALFAGDVAIPAMVGFEDDDEMPSQVFSVRLGKFESSKSDDDDDDGDGETSNKLDDRRCYSMGTFRYVVGESDLRVTSSRFFGGKLEGNNKKIGTVREKGESFSVSKIWLRLPGCSDTDIRVSVPVVGFPANCHQSRAQV